MTVAQPPVLETLIDLRPPELEKPSDLDSVCALRMIAQGETVMADARDMEPLLARSPLYACLQDTFAAQVFVTRLAHHCPTARLTDGVVVLAGLLSLGSPGRAVQWAHAVAKACCQLDTQRTGSLSFDRLMVTYFMDGLPAEAGHQRLWEAQKRPLEHRREHKGSDNWLDYSPETWRWPAPAEVVAPGANWLD